MATRNRKKVNFKTVNDLNALVVNSVSRLPKRYNSHCRCSAKRLFSG